MKYVKYLVSFLLIFGLTVNEYSSNSQVTTEYYHQVSFVGTREEMSRKDSSLFIYRLKILSGKVLWTFPITYRTLKDVFSTQLQTIFKVQIGLYRQLHSVITQNVYLNKRFTSSTQYAGLYIA